MKTTADRMQVFPDHFFAGLNSRIRELQAQGRDVIRLDIGSPDLPPDPHIIEALKRSAERSNSHGYQPHQGLLSLRQAWVEMYQRLYQVDLDPQSEVQPLLGSKEGIFNLVMSSVNPGDVVLVPDPGYLTYNAATRFAGGEPVFMPLTGTHNYLPDLEAIPNQILGSARMLWLNYPNNPTAGGVADQTSSPGWWTWRMSTICWYAMMRHIPRLHMMDTRHPAFYRCQVQRLWPLNSIPCQNLTIWPDGAQE